MHPYFETISIGVWSTDRYNDITTRHGLFSISCNDIWLIHHHTALCDLHCNQIEGNRTDSKDSKGPRGTEVMDDISVRHWGRYEYPWEVQYTFLSAGPISYELIRYRVRMDTTYLTMHFVPFFVGWQAVKTGLKLIEVDVFSSRMSILCLKKDILEEEIQQAYRRSVSLGTYFISSIVPSIIIEIKGDPMIFVNNAYAGFFFTKMYTNARRKGCLR